MNKILKSILVSIIILSIFLNPALSFTNEQDYVITLKDHVFTPAELIVPANKKIKLVVENQDPTPEEFESFDLNREKIVSGNGKIMVFLGPLKPGRYKYFGEFHQDTAQGVIVAR